MARNEGAGRAASDAWAERATAEDAREATVGAQSGRAAASGARAERATASDARDMGAQGGVDLHYGHPRMPLSDRAKIFAPFNPLRGFTEALRAAEDKHEHDPLA